MRMDFVKANFYIQNEDIQMLEDVEESSNFEPTVYQDTNAYTQEFLPNYLPLFYEYRDERALESQGVNEVWDWRQWESQVCVKQEADVETGGVSSQSEEGLCQQFLS